MTVFALNRHAIIALALTAAFIPSASFAASCVEGPAKMSDSDIQAFLASPDGLLSSNVSGGLNLSNTIRQLVASDSGSLDAVIKLVSSANKSQASAIAGGLARAVQACKTVDPAYADKIQQSVATIQDTSFLEAFASASSQIATASLGQGRDGARSRRGFDPDEHLPNGRHQRIRIGIEQPLNLRNLQFFFQFRDVWPICVKPDELRAHDEHCRIGKLRQLNV